MKRRERAESACSALQGDGKREGPVSEETSAQITAFITDLREALEGAGNPVRAE